MHLHISQPDKSVQARPSTNVHFMVVFVSLKFRVYTPQVATLG